MGLFKKELAFEKIELSKSKIDSDKTTTIKVNVKNYKDKVDNIILKVKTDDQSNQYVTINNPIIALSPLDFPDKNTGEHEITITPHNIPLSKMSFKITVEVFGNNKEKPILEKEFNLTVNKKS
jgi:hypothetical protein